MDLLTTQQLVTAARHLTARRVPPMAHQSHPVPRLQGGALRACFLYGPARPVFGEGLSMVAPGHLATLDPAQGDLLELRAVKPADLGVNDPPQKLLGFWKMPPDLTTEQFLADQQRLYRALDKLLPLYARDKPPDPEAAETYEALFQQLSEGPLGPYYRAAGRSFFDWVGMAE